MSGIMVKNVDGGSELSMVSDGSKHLLLPRLIPKEVPCRKATIINPLQPYKTMTGVFENEVSLLKLPDLNAGDVKLIDCSGASYIALHVLAPEALVLATFADPCVWTGFIVGYVAKDAARSVFCPTYVNEISDRTFKYAGHKDIAEYNQFVKTTIDGKVFAISATDYIPTLGFERVQLIFSNSAFTTGVTFSGTINVYCVPI